MGRGGGGADPRSPHCNHCFIYLYVVTLPLLQRQVYALQFDRKTRMREREAGERERGGGGVR